MIVVIKLEKNLQKQTRKSPNTWKHTHTQSKYKRSKEIVKLNKR